MKWVDGGGGRRSAPFECPDETATAEAGMVKDKSITRDIPFALRRGTIGQVTTGLDAASAPPSMSSPSTRRAGIALQPPLPLSVSEGALAGSY